MADQAFAIVQVVVEVDVDGPWGGTCTISQLKDQATREGRDKLQLALQRIRGVRLRNTMSVRGVVVQDKADDRERTTETSDRRALWEALTDLLDANPVEVEAAKARTQQTATSSRLDTTLTDEEREQARALLADLAGARFRLDAFRKGL